MTARTRLLLLASVSLAAIPCLALAHNGRDGAPPPLAVWSRGLAQAQPQARAQARTPSSEQKNPSEVGKFVNIYEGIVVRVDPKTGVRSYVQVGDVPANPARARSVATSAGSGPGVDFWVGKEFEKNQPAPAAEPAYAYNETAPQVSSYDEGYYGGYIPYAYGGYGYGGGSGRPGDGHGGGGRPGHGGGGGGGGGDNPPPRTNGGIIQQPYRPSAPAGPYGGGVGSPPPYDDRGVGAPPPAPRHNGFRRG
jgi:hypothetical protein